MRGPLDRRIFLLALIGALPGLVLALLFVWTGPASLPTRIALTLALGALPIVFAAAAAREVRSPLHLLANLLAALRQGDFTLRARPIQGDDTLGDALREFNLLGEALQAQRVGALEATALLRRVMEEIDVAIFAFDSEDRLQLVNHAGERLLGAPAERLIGYTATFLGLEEPRRLAPGRTLDATFPGGAGRWEVRRSTIRQSGLPMELMVLADVTKALREEERLALQRLVRVLSHEINNSLAPIHSLAATLRGMVDRTPPPEDLGEDLRRGLEVISGRADALQRFMASYARLAKLPPPTLGLVEVDGWVRRVVALEGSALVEIQPGPVCVIRADGDQLDQALINLVKNAVEAVAATGGRVQVGWSLSGQGTVDVWVRDEGPGLGSTTNIFVPFFTTKPGGSGIGLALARQIAEAHGGTLALDNRTDSRGAIARLRLPLPPPVLPPSE